MNKMNRLVVALAFIVLALVNSEIASAHWPVPPPTSARIARLTQNKRPLSLSQIKQLIAIKTPDEAIAGEIKDRGLSFRLDAATLDDLRVGGAGPATAKALAAFLPKASLTILSTPPECEIYVDDSLRGSTNNEGKLRLSDLTPGDHKIGVRKTRYREAIYSVSLSPNKEERSNSKLELAVGFLKVNTIPKATIEISGLGRFTGPVDRTECSPGRYSITVSRPLHITAVREAIVTAGEETEISVPLEADQEAAGRILAAAREAYSHGQYDRAVAFAQNLLSALPSHAEALSILTATYFMKNEFANFTETAGRALEAGGTIKVQLKHHHAFGSSLHLITLTLTARTISFDPQPAGPAACSHKPFTVPVQALAAAELTGNGRNEIYLRLTFADLADPKKTAKLNFTDQASYFVKGQKTTAGGFIRYTGDIMVSRREAEAAVSAIARVFEGARTNARKQ